MTEGLQTVFLAVGNAVLHSFWQTGLLWLLVILHSKNNSNLSAAHLSRVSFLALIAGLLAFIITFAVTLSNPSALVSLLGWKGYFPSSHFFLSGIALVYFIILVLQVVRLAVAGFKVRQIRVKGLTRVPGHLKIFFLDACQYLGIKRKVQLYSSALISSPLTIGFFKPAILIPVALPNQLTLREAESVILHELAHIRRNDYLKNLVTQLALVVLYFNPFAKMLAKIQGLEAEKSADNWVMQFEYNNKEYARTLLSLARGPIAISNTLAMPMSGNRLPLLERVEWILGMKKRRQPSLRNLLSATAIIVLTFFISFSTRRITQTEVPVVSFLPAHKQAIAYEKTDDNRVPENTGVLPVSTTASTRIKKEKAIPKDNHSVAAEEVEPANDASQEYSPRFVKEVTLIAPLLPESKEQNIRQALKATQKIVLEASWELLEKSLAETITPEEKEKLKKIYSSKIWATNLDKQANALRANYDNINWQQLISRLTSTVDHLKLDSLYGEYKQQAAELNRYRKEIATDSTRWQEQQIVSSLMDEYKNVLSKIDSLRSKKIVEL